MSKAASGSSWAQQAHAGQNVAAIQEKQGIFWPELQGCIPCLPRSFQHRQRVMASH